jgi:hypothetical protein
MKKNLQKILVLALGLTTTIASAQFSANSTSRIDQTNSDDRSITNRIALSADYGAVHVSADVTGTNSGVDTNGVRDAYATGSYEIYEAYASTDLMGFGTLTVGKRDLSFGSGALISSNDWGFARHTQNGISLDANLGGFDVSIGSMGGVNYDAANYMNASGNFGGADVNILMMNGANDTKAHGYDLSYAMNNFTISASMNSDFEGDEMTSYGLTYNVTDDLSASFGRTSYGDSVNATATTNRPDGNTGFDMANTSTNDGWASGNMGYLNSGDEATTMGISYDLGDITLSYTMATVSNENTEADDREVTIMSLGYALNDNCNVSMSRFSDSALETATDDGERTYVTISIGL